MDSPELSHMPYEPPESLWKLVEGGVSQEEREEIRKILGDSLVDQSLELHAEVSTLLDIWQCFRCETDTTVHAAPSPKFLPEPPGMRDSLRNHIKMLVDNIREKTGRNSEGVFSQHKHDVIEYAMDSSSRGSSPGGMRSRPSSSYSSRSGRETPMRMTPSSEGDRTSSSSTASDKVESVRDQLNVLKIDEVVLELRSTLKDEILQLLSDIKFLQSCVEEERDFRCESQVSSYSEPTLQELREERCRLERTSSSIPDSIDIINTLPTGRRKSAPGSPKGLLKPLSISSKSSLRPSPPTTPSKLASTTKPLPLKGRHTHGCSGPPDPKKLLDNNMNHQAVTARTCTNNNVNKKDLKKDAPASVGSSLSSGTMRPSPPSSAKRGSASSSRLRQRFREAPKLDNT